MFDEEPMVKSAFKFTVEVPMPTLPEDAILKTDDELSWKLRKSAPVEVSWFTLRKWPGDVARAAEELAEPDEGGGGALAGDARGGEGGVPPGVDEDGALEAGAAVSDGVYLDGVHGHAGDRRGRGDDADAVPHAPGAGPGVRLTRSAPDSIPPVVPPT